MLKKLLFVLITVAVVMVSGQSVSAQRVDEPQVTFCHATNSATNPYVQLTVDQSAVDGAGNGNADHYGHTGPIATSEEVAQALKDQQIDWGDIIPPVPGFHAGLNWTTEGQAMLANGCNPVGPNTPGEPGRGGDTPTTTTPASTSTPAATSTPASLPKTSGETALTVVATVSAVSLIAMLGSIAGKALYVKFF